MWHKYTHTHERKQSLLPTVHRDLNVYCKIHRIDDCYKSVHGTFKLAAYVLRISAYFNLKHN